MSSASTASGKAASTLPLHSVFAFACLNLPAAALLLTIGLLMPRFYAGHLGISLAAVGASFFILRLIDVSLDPIVGVMIDRTKTPIGRFRPWVIAGGAVLMFAIYKAFNPPPGVGTGYLIVWVGVLYAGYSMFVLGQAAWGGAIALNYHERSKLYGWMQAIGVLGSVCLLMLSQFTGGKVQFGKHESMGTIGWIMIIAVPLCLAVALMFTPERAAPLTERKRFALSDYLAAISRPDMRRLILADLTLTLGPGMTGSIYIFFFHDAKGFSIPNTSSLLVFFIGAGLVGSPFWARVAQSVGKYRAVQIACFCYAISQSTLMAVPRGMYLMTALAMLTVGFCSSAFIPLVRAMVADVADEIRLETGRDLLGACYAMVTTTQKVGLAISVAIVFPVLGLVGYKAADSAHNTPQAIFGLEMCYLFAPVVFVFVGAAMFIGYRLNAARHAEVRAALDARDGMIDEAAALETLTGATPEVAT
jgi:GPH family glycoside/pentoside/hexuronide:cation symporter